MSMLAIKLFEERENKNEDYLPLMNAVFGSKNYDLALNQNEEFAADVQEILYTLDENDVFGLLQRYYVEEYFLHGKSKEEIGKEIAANMELLLADLESSAIRYLRHPARSKGLAAHLK